MANGVEWINKIIRKFSGIFRSVISEINPSSQKNQKDYQFFIVIFCKQEVNRRRLLKVLWKLSLSPGHPVHRVLINSSKKYLLI